MAGNSIIEDYDKGEGPTVTVGGRIGVVPCLFGVPDALCSLLSIM